MVFTVVWKKKQLSKEKQIKATLDCHLNCLCIINKEILEILERQLDMKDKAP